MGSDEAGVSAHHVTRLLQFGQSAMFYQQRGLHQGEELLTALSTLTFCICVERCLTPTAGTSEGV